VEPKVFRGIGARRAAWRLSSSAIAYAGVVGVLWGLGLSVRGVEGWLLVSVPLLAAMALRLTAWRRVSATVTDGTLRYESAVPRRDFDVSLEALEAVYFDATLPGRPLVAVLGDGDERVCGELSPRAARDLFRYLRERGVPTLPPAPEAPRESLR